MWIFTIALALTDIYVPYSSIKDNPHDWSTGERTLFWALRWPIWGFFIVWVIFACQYNYAGEYDFSLIILLNIIDSGTYTYIYNLV